MNAIRTSRIPRVTKHPRWPVGGGASAVGPRVIRISQTQGSNQSQKFLLFWSIAGRGEKGSDLNLGDLATRGKIGLVPDEHSATVGIKGEQPPIPVGTEVNCSSPNGHAEFAPCSDSTI